MLPFCLLISLAGFTALRYNAGLMSKTSSQPKTNKKTSTAAVAEHDHQHDHHDHQHDHEHDHSKESYISANEKILLSLPWAQVDESYQKQLRQAAKNFKTEGFRQGKAPLALVEKNLGSERLIEATLQELVPSIYEAAVKTLPAEKRPITLPEFNPIKLNKGEDWQVEAYFAAFPQIDLKNYKKSVATGNKKAAEFIKDQNAALKKAAEEKKNTEKGAEKTVTQSKELSENEQNEIRLQHIFQALVADLKPTIPELLLRQETQSEFERLLKQLEQFQMKLEDYLKRREITIETLSNELASTVLGRLQVDFILATISQTEKLAVDDTEIATAFEKIEDAKVREQLRQDERYTQQLKANLLQQKTLDFLLKLD
jgi:FKBP-type peptidyl-prolyl cis-trans isomerase (trigger factor)